MPRTFVELATGSLGAKSVTSQAPLPWSVGSAVRIGFLSPLPTLLRAAKRRRKGDRLVISCQEQTYWLVNKPPVSPHVVEV